jgi:hypothetical protein
MWPKTVVTRLSDIVRVSLEMLPAWLIIKDCSRPSDAAVAHHLAVSFSPESGGRADRTRQNGAS